MRMELYPPGTILLVIDTIATWRDSATVHPLYAGDVMTVLSLWGRTSDVYVVLTPDGVYLTSGAWLKRCTRSVT